MIKTYLIPTLFMFFLLVDTCVSGPLGFIFKPFSNSFTKKAGEELAKQAAENALQNELENLINPNNDPPTAPNTPPVKIEGLHIVKEYLSKYGYIPYSDPFTDYMDREMVLAITTYQKFFNLKVSGKLDNNTLRHMVHPRCAVPDFHIRYNINPKSNVSWPVGTEWFLNSRNRKELTYGFLPVSEIPPNATKVFRNSFERWSQAIKVLNFTETESYDEADIKIGFYLFDNKTFKGEVVGATFILSRESDNNSNYVKISGDMRLNGEEYWVLATNSDVTTWPFPGELDLETVVMHQIGHLLGLNHSSVEEAVMYPSILPSWRRKTQLSNDDEAQIQEVYYSAGGSSRGIVTTLSIGFAVMLLFD